MSFNRANKEPEQSEPEQVLQPEQKQPEQQHEHGDGKCIGCGKEFAPSFPACLCLNCFNKGITHESLGLILWLV